MRGDKSCQKQPEGDIGGQICLREGAKNKTGEGGLHTNQNLWEGSNENSQFFKIFSPSMGGRWMQVAGFLLGFHQKTVHFSRFFSSPSPGGLWRYHHKTAVYLDITPNTILEEPVKKIYQLQYWKSQYTT